MLNNIFVCNHVNLVSFDYIIEIYIFSFVFLKNNDYIYLYI